MLVQPGRQGRSLIEGLFLPLLAFGSVLRHGQHLRERLHEEIRLPSPYAAVS